MQHPSDTNTDIGGIRSFTIPLSFVTVADYRVAMCCALYEQLNVQLFEVGEAYHRTLQTLDLSEFESTRSTVSGPMIGGGPTCPHGLAKLAAVKKEGKNHGRLFYVCPNAQATSCKFFQWADEVSTSASASRVRGVKVTSSPELQQIMRTKGVQLYTCCTLSRKQMQCGRYGRVHAPSKKLFLTLSKREHSSQYGKDDLWVVSRGEQFHPAETFVARSTFFGPNSCSEIELERLDGTNGTGGGASTPFFAIHAFNAGGELSAIENINANLQSQNFPLLPYLMHNSPTPHVSGLLGITALSQRLFITLDDALVLAHEHIDRFHLNAHQAEVVIACTQSLWREDGPIILVHGVYGSGKSFLVAVLIVFLDALFGRSDASIAKPAEESGWKILVSSTTNVAVDRILNGLLDLGFENFVRVGSAKKIARHVLPFSTHGTASSDKVEVRELRAMLRDGHLTATERRDIHKSIERLSKGENLTRIATSRVVGVTCAASGFACMDCLQFPLVILDECCQMTEPSALLPIARFCCQRLVLVGDPKQLSPTLPGPTPPHKLGLEQTLFQRLIMLGVQPVILRTQYRCHPQIAAMSNAMFYDGRLLEGVCAHQRSPLVSLPPVSFVNVNGVEERSGGGSFSNQAEVRFVASLIGSLLEADIGPGQIGIITLYRSQARIISDLLKRQW